MGVKVYHDGNWIDFSTGSIGSSGNFLVQNDGTDLVGLATALNFKGSGVTASNTTGNPSTKIIDISGATSFLNLTDTPSSYTNNASKFVRVKTDGSGLEFLTQTPTTGAAGNNRQVQYNDGSTLQGANGLEFIKWVNATTTPIAPSLVLKPDSGFSASGVDNNYGGGNITTQTKLDGGNPSVPWNRATLTADGSLELMRRRVETPTGGPYIDFKSQLGDGDPVDTNMGEDMDARIQMDYALENGSINTSSADYSAITFQTGGRGYPNSANTNGNVVERLRIGKNGEIGILAGLHVAGGGANTRSDAEKYGQSGYVLTSNGKGNSVSWTSKGTPSGSNFTTPLTVRIPATQPGINLNDTVNIAEFNSNTGVNQSKLLIYNKRTVAPPNNSGWENTAMFIQRQIDDPSTGGSNFGWIQFGDGSGTGGKNGSTLHFGTGIGADAAERLRIDGDGNIGIGTINPTGANAVGIANTSVLAVGVVTCRELYVNGTQITGSGGSGSGGGNYESYISSFSGDKKVEFTNIPSWATKITLLGENVLLPDPTNGTISNNKVGTILEFGGSGGYLGADAYTNLTSFITSNPSYGVSEYDDSPYADHILLNSSSVNDGPILSQIHLTFEKVKNQNKWVYSGSIANRKGNLNSTTDDFKFFNDFAGSFTATETLTKLKLYSWNSQPNDYPSNITLGPDFTGGTLTAIYEGEGGGSGGSGGGGSSDPVGTIVAWAGSVASIPSEYQLCDGTSAQTSALQAITGTNVPDLRSRFIVGAYNVTGTGSWPNVGVGSTGGAAEVTLTVDQMPAHTHDIETGDNPDNDGDSVIHDETHHTYSDYADAAKSTGGNQPHENLPPYYALCYIIKHTASSGSATSTALKTASARIIPDDFATNLNTYQNAIQASITPARTDSSILVVVTATGKGYYGGPSANQQSDAEVTIYKHGAGTPYTTAQPWSGIGYTLNSSSSNPNSVSQSMLDNTNHGGGTVYYSVMLKRLNGGTNNVTLRKNSAINLFEVIT